MDYPSAEAALVVAKEAMVTAMVKASEPVFERPISPKANQLYDAFVAEVGPNYIATRRCINDVVDAGMQVVRNAISKPK